MAEEHYFLALWPDFPLALEIERRVRPFWEAVPGMRQVAPQNYHLTLAFLGFQPPAARVSIAGCVDPLGWGRFDLTLDRLGGFRRSRILFFAPSTIPPALTDLVRRLRSGLIDALGASLPATGGESLSFAPHVTLARCVRVSAEARPAPALVWPVERLCLARTCPGGDYEIISEWRLSGLEERV